MPRLGFTGPRLGMAAGAFHWRRGPPPPLARLRRATADPP